MRTVLLFVLSLTCGTQGAGAQPWSLAACGAQHAAAHGAFEQKVLSAKPGSPLYVPHPYPRTKAQVVANFAYQLQTMWSDAQPADIPPDEERALAAIAADRLTAEMVRVENWSLTRCGSQQRRVYFHVLRLFDRETGRELGRAALDDTGLLGMGTHFSADPTEAKGQLERRSFPRLPEVAQRIQGTFGLPVWSAQYVHSTGMVRCDLLSPCVAFKSQGRTYLYGPILEREALYRIEEGRPLLSFRRDLADHAKKTAVERTLGPKQRVISLGGDTFTVANKVEPPTP